MKFGRFVYNNSVLKATDFIDFPIYNLDLSKYSTSVLKYNLFGVIV